MKSKFKDKCDECEKFDYLISNDEGKCLCTECSKKKNNFSERIKETRFKQMTIFDIMNKKEI